MDKINGYKKIFQNIVATLKISKPIVFFDLKTTGPAINVDKLIEIAYIKVLPNGRAIKDNFLIDPEIEVSEESMEFHNITNEVLAHRPNFKERAKEVWEIFNNCYYAGFNILDFDLPVLRREFARVGMDFDYKQEDIIDSKVIFGYMEPNTLSVTYSYYAQKEHLGSNKAMSDVEASLEIFHHQFHKYKEIRDRKFINEIYNMKDDRLRGHERKFYWRDGEAYFNFSKYQDTPLSEVARFDPDYLKWILEADFSREIKNIVKTALNKERENKD